MTDLLITNVRALEPGQGEIASWLRLSGGKIAATGPADRLPSDISQTIDGGGRLMTPGFVDVHTHGIEHYAYEADVEQLLEASRHLGRYGTTCAFPTLYQSMSKDKLSDLERFAAALTKAEDACLPGLHLEGPFMAVTGAGAQTIPGDVGLLDELLAAAGGKTKIMSLSPEVANIVPVIERLCERGVIPFVTHTRATLAQVEAALDAGARHATHFYDVFPLPPETDPGVRPVGAVEAFLADPRATVDFIADGVHVHPTAIRAAAAAKGWQGVILITDSNIGAGLPPGIYESPVGGTVKIAPGDAARIHSPGSPLHNVLAGSALTMDRGMSNLSKWLDLPLEKVWAMGTANPARLLGLANKGTLRIGADADLVLWDRTSDGVFQAKRTWVGGRCVFEAKE
jgi:N-acetylglucosamine-6-phosphate deacetylase